MLDFPSDFPNSGWRVLGDKLGKKVGSLIIHGITLPLIPLFTVKHYKLLCETLVSTNPGLLPQLRRDNYHVVWNGKIEVQIVL